MDRKVLQKKLEIVLKKKLLEKVESKDYSLVLENLRKSKLLYPDNLIVTDDKRELGKKVFLTKDLPKLLNTEREESYYFNTYVKEWVPLAKSRRLKFEKNKEFIPGFEKVIRSLDSTSGHSMSNWSPETVAKKVQTPKDYFRWVNLLQ